MATQGLRLLQSPGVLAGQSRSCLRVHQAGVFARRTVPARQQLCCSAAVATEAAPAAAAVASKFGPGVRVRFAPSPTGSLHVGGARTALFNWLYAKNTGGKFVLRVEDTDVARSTRESEQAMVRDLKWLGLDWDEGPDLGGPAAPYRQSERTDVYRGYVDTLVEQGRVYPCFCTDEELAVMKGEAERLKLPPIYRGKWGKATAEEVAAEKAKGTPCCYRFRVPPNRIMTINDIVRGKVSWNTDTLGDFVVLRSNGLPVYNFCVAVDDAMMGITHVIRAEEHLPNTLRQVLIYEALGFPQPTFTHVSLILAPDKSKLSKRHGATSVGEFREQGFLAPAMINYLSLLGWNDGTEQEIFTPEELQSKFSLDRVTKSAAVFDKVKLAWMNGQHLRALADEELVPLIGGQLVEAGVLAKADSPLAVAAAQLLKGSVELVNDAAEQLRPLLTYPLEATVASAEAKAVVDDDFKQVANAVLAAYDSGDLTKALESGHDGFKDWLKALGKSQKRKGKRLFMPARVAFTGLMKGPDVGGVLGMLQLDDGASVAPGADFVPLAQRMEVLRAVAATLPAAAPAAA